ncbi:MAG: Na+/H+ antiporter subunit E [Candidatus Verstraetearchaeota archaeon]|nr:Na+/H+ antiporter subunit E [Candidatus Verstraetearchaeota archaeon]
MGFIWGVRFWFCLVREIVSSVVDVSKRCLNGDIDPYIHVIDTVLENPVSQVMLANSITYTPGTVTIDIDVEGKRLYVGTISPRGKCDIIPLEPHVERWLGR